MTSKSEPLESITVDAGSCLVIGTCTDTGAVRKRNEDSIHSEPFDSPESKASGWLGIVADGMGGRNFGDLASRLATSTTRDAYYQPQKEASRPSERIRTAIETANDVILRASRSSAEHAGMGTTITAAVIEGSKMVVAQVGDSRGYLIRNSRLRQVTRDHSLVDELVRDGKLTREEALHHPQRNVITRALGTQTAVLVDIFEEELRDGDVVLLCSDGLYRVVTNAEMARALVAEPQAAAESLIALANERGGPDNISVIIVRVCLPEQLDRKASASPATDIGETTLVG